MQVVRFLYTNKTNLSRPEVLRIAANEFIEEGNLQELWMCFLLLSKGGVDLLPCLLRLGICIARQT
jgi:hypothetical protein